MIQSNATVDIYRMTGDEDNKEYALHKTGVKVLIVPASTEIIALYSDVPMGGLYSCLITNQIDNINSQDKFVINSPGTSGLAKDNELIVNGVPRTTVMFRNKYIESVAVKI